MKQTEFLAGEFDVNRSLRDLDVAAEAVGWMAEPRDMIHIRRSTWYRRSIAAFVASVDPGNFMGRPMSRVVSHQFIFWRILDWGCGMDSAVRSWLDRHAKGSVTHALRTGDTASMKEIYASQLRGPRARVVRVAAPTITACLDYAERLFGFHTVQDIAGIIPFFASRIPLETDRVHDAVYFLSRAVRFTLNGGAAGFGLLSPLMPCIRGAEPYLETLREHPACCAQSEYTCAVGQEGSRMTVAEEARLGLRCILNAWERRSAEEVDYLLVWDNAVLDEAYGDLYGVPLRDHRAANYEESGKPE